MSSVLLENPEAETRWYFKYFLGHNHSNYVATLQVEHEPVGLHGETALTAVGDGQSSQL